ncbi:hypothetical protein [Streptomyces sp. 5-10]|uniref:hypothetical protein n=1 Tax=Streptomyces sp. 5-10 TaxID=878925 RepID=UPI00168B84D8|nr:hypothetical protein [Streptomyces sp. 5-10]MBD3004781.1 hypothetical protein [Streptomyces sp. 5-10]
MNLDNTNLYNDDTNGAYLRDLRGTIAAELADSHPGATDEQLTYLANLRVGMLFAFPGSTMEEIEAEAEALHRSRVEAGNPLAVGVEDALIDTVYRPVYDAAVLLKTDPAKALRSKFDLSLKEARRIAARITESGKDGQEGATSEPDEAAEGAASLAAVPEDEVA